VIWDKSQKWVRLEHASPFTPKQQYRIKLSIKEGTFESHFKTLPPDPGELLESDLAQGVITPDEAAQYHIRRIYNPKDVPEKYRYATAPYCGTWDMLQAANLRDRLKPETVKALEPYLVSVKNPKSIFYKRFFRSGQSSSAAAPSLIATAHAAVPSDPFEEVYQTDTGFRIVITGDPKEPSHAELVRRARELIEKHKMYEKFEKLLDHQTIDINNNKTLLIFIFASILESSDEDRTLRVSGLCKPLIENTESATTVPEIEISGPLMVDDLTLASTLAHEMFHAFQFAFSHKEQKWLKEGSATWAEDFIGRDWNTEQSRLRYTFQGAHHNSIITKNLDEAYGMYLFFYYLTRVATGGNETIMRQIWKNCKANPSNTFESVRAALPGELSGVLKEYALFTLDVEQYKGKFPDAVGAYGGENPLNLSGHHRIREFGKINADGAIEIERLVGMPAMGIMYFKVENEATGVTAPAIKFNLEEFLKEKHKAIGIQAVIKFRNGRQEMEDWTGRKERIFCLAKESQNFETLYLVASWAEGTERIESLVLDIEPALKEECLGAQLSITVSDYGQRDVKITSTFLGSSTTNETSSWDRKVIFDLDLASVTPITPVSKPVPYGDIKKLLPKELSKKEASEVAEFLKYGTHYDMGTHCPLAVFRVKDCRVSTVSGTKKVKKDHISYDDLGSLAEEYTYIYNETWSSEGLDKKIIESMHFAEKKGNIGPGWINVHIDPETKQIKWVYLVAMIANCRIDWSSEKEGRRREKSGYKTINESKSGSKKTKISAHKVSSNSKDLPMNPDWRAKQSTKTTATGGGKKERSLDHESYDSYRREKVVTTGKHVETIEWNLDLGVPPDIK